MGVVISDVPSRAVLERTFHRTMTETFFFFFKYSIVIVLKLDILHL